MGSARDVKNRIKSVKNIAQITRALEAVSASRVRRAQERATASRAYAQKAWEILLNIQAASTGTLPHPLLMERSEVNAVMIVLITSDRGLAGSYNTNVIRVAQRFEERLGKPVKYVTIGRKGRDTMFRSGRNVVAEFSDLPADPSIADLAPIAKLAIDAYMNGEVDEVLIAYTDFITMLTQSPVVLGWLPLTTNTVAHQVAAEYVKDVPAVTAGRLDYEYEPNAAAVLDEIVPRFTELQLFQAVLESQASEHAARMNAMRNATDNASQLVGDLTLEYNKARQAAITNEILDIVGGANALEATVAAESKRVAVRDVEKSNGALQVVPKASQAKSSPTGSDDLTKIEGIGPKMANALKEAGIDTFVRLAASAEDVLREAIEKAGMRFSPSLPTWAKQAGYAASGDWDGLKKYQDELVGGRKVD